MVFNWKEHWPLYLIFSLLFIAIGVKWTFQEPPLASLPDPETVPDYWIAPSLYTDNKLSGTEREKVIYGEDLITNTAQYFGPSGKVNAITNGMNCQNCHLDAGRKEWGNNYGAVFSTYPKFRDRSGTVETISKRINDCFERSLNGTAIDTTSREMQAMIAYISWLGANVKKGEKPKGSGIQDLPYMDRAADPLKGKLVFLEKCQNCHGTNGQGILNDSQTAYLYPPLWGEHSYNTGAGLYRLSRMAGYVKNNMPFNQASHANPVLTTEEAWDVAAFINTQSRPKKDLSKDWPEISKKPVDHPFGPYTDGFSEQQHKLGPFQPIVEARKKIKKSS